MVKRKSKQKKQDENISPLCQNVKRRRVQEEDFGDGFCDEKSSSYDSLLFESFSEDLFIGLFF